MKPAFLFLSVFVILLAGCCNKKTRIAEKAAAEPNKPTMAVLVEPRTEKTYVCGDSIEIKFRVHPDSLPFIDSLVIVSEHGDKQIITNGFETFFWKTGRARVGKINLKLSFFMKGNREVHPLSFILLSDIQPAKYTYRIIRQYPHDEKAFTEGLFFDHGVLYESTGPEGESSLRIVDIKTGIPVKRYDLERQFFAEGIALFNNQIYQLTYKTQVGFIYDKETLQLIRRFDYPIKEGWGLTSNGKNLIMSDGSARLYFLEPEYFTQVAQLDVYDNKGMITYLNELEYINGKILANIWFKNIIVIIDPASGKVTGQIDLEEIVPESLKDDSNKVLNGIAFNPQNKHLYITGKYWPVLFELEISPAL